MLIVGGSSSSEVMLAFDPLVILGFGGRRGALRSLFTSKLKIGRRDIEGLLQDGYLKLLYGFNYLPLALMSPILREPLDIPGLRSPKSQALLFLEFGSRLESFVVCEPQLVNESKNFESPSIAF